MERTYRKWLPQVSTLQPCLIALLSFITLSFQAHAAPPGKTPPTSFLSTPIPASLVTPHPSHLDLRPPPMREYAEMNSLTEESRRGATTRDDSVSHDYRHSFPAWEKEARQPAIVARAEAMAERFRHEGLPVARLWENHAALVSVGLNGRGKPGIWLVQKTH